MSRRAAVRCYDIPALLAQGGNGMARARGDQRGSLEKRKTGWFGRWREFTLLPDNTIAWKQTGWRKLTDGSKADAIEKLNEELARANGAAACPQGMATVRQFVEARFLPDHVETLKPNGKRHYENMLPRILEAFGSTRLRDVNHHMVQAWLNLLAKPDKNGKQRSAQTIAHYRNALSAVYTHAKRCGFWRGDLPTEYVKTPEIHHEPGTALSADQVGMLLARLEEPHRTLVLLIASTGLRIGEALALDWSRVNIGEVPAKRDHGWIMPRVLQVRVNFSNGEWSTPKSRKSIRDIPVSDELAAAMEPLAVPGQGWLVFPNRWGRPLDAHNLSARVLKPACRAAGLPPIGWHDLRHTALTLMQQNGMSQAEAKMIAGHSSESITAGYTHGFLERARAVMGAVRLATEVLQ
jgi:integrase